MASSSHRLQCIVVTPERAVLDEPADFVAVPMYDGELGVLPGRAPLIGRLGYGELRIREDSQTKRFYVDGGFAQIRNNVVTVLTQRAIRAEDIDTQRVQHDLQSALAGAATPELQESRLKFQERARAQLRVARKDHPGVAHE